MKPKIVILLLGSSFSLGTAQLSLRQGANEWSSSNPTFAPESLERSREGAGFMIQADGGYFLFRINHYWDPTYTVRMGVGKKMHALSLCFFFEYYHFDLALNPDLGSFKSQVAKREDFCGYLTAIIFSYVEFGIGANYTSSDKVSIFSQNGEEPWIYSGIKEFRIFYSFGARYNVNLGSGMYVPVGLYYRNTDYGTRDLFPILLRVGLMKEL